MDFTQHVRLRENPASLTPQSAPLPGREAEQAVNHAGGYVFRADDWMYLDRFLILGSTGTYYVGARELTREAADVVARCLAADPIRTVVKIVEISESGRAPRVDQCLFALAMAMTAHYSPEPGARAEARRAFPRVVRTASHLAQWCHYSKALRGRGRAWNRAVGDWFAGREPMALAYQVAKYANRNGWTPRDLLRLTHPRASSDDHNLVMRWAVGKDVDLTADSDAARYLSAIETVKTTESKADVLRLIVDHRLTHEVIPSTWLGDADVWGALLTNMPMTAMVRNLGRMTANGLIAPLSDAAGVVTGRLRDADRISRARVHPISLLAALKVYSAGRGVRGGLKWEPNARIVDALNDAFYGAFVSLTPTGKRQIIGVDVSGSMGIPAIGVDFMSAAEAAAAMALITVAADPDTTVVVAFNTEARPITITPRMRLDDVMALTRANGGTDCDATVRWAEKNGIAADAIVVVTDTETWAGPRHVASGLAAYRGKYGEGVRAVSMSTALSAWSLGDPTDTNFLNVVGFDTAAPGLVADFVAGRL